MGGGSPSQAKWELTITYWRLAVQTCVQQGLHKRWLRGRKSVESHAAHDAAGLHISDSVLVIIINQRRGNITSAQREPDVEVRLVFTELRLRPNAAQPLRVPKKKQPASCEPVRR
mmetsp:Transcript_60087/g.82308  ORF Transcript_60087/g.82308 Transcript_60087/m.82308 type:complete len:115 (-) Transcript_60087:302-646(-)